jgi:hypothetical protein
MADPPWQWLNHHRIIEAVIGLGPDARVDVADALDHVLAKPFEPLGVEITTLKIESQHLERRVAWLPHDLFMTYRPYLDGPMPHRGRHIVVLAVSTMQDLFEALNAETDTDDDD